MRDAAEAAPRPVTLLFFDWASALAADERAAFDAPLEPRVRPAVLAADLLVRSDLAISLFLSRSTRSGGAQSIWRERSFVNEKGSRRPTEPGALTGSDVPETARG